MHSIGLDDRVMTTPLGIPSLLRGGSTALEILCALTSPGSKCKFILYMVVVVFSFFHLLYSECEVFL